MTEKILYFDMDGVLADFQGYVAQNPPDPDVEVDEIDGLFAQLEPIEGAIDAFNILFEHFDCYILSTAPWGNVSAWSDKREWVERYLGEAAKKRLILSHNKHLNMGDYLIDDRTANGAGQFTGEHIHFGTDQFPDWDAVLQYLLGDQQ